MDGCKSHSRWDMNSCFTWTRNPHGCFDHLRTLHKPPLCEMHFMQPLVSSANHFCVKDCHVSALQVMHALLHGRFVLYLCLKFTYLTTMDLLVMAYLCLFVSMPTSFILELFNVLFNVLYKLIEAETFLQYNGTCISATIPKL